jgi:hypothetical protein
MGECPVTAMSTARHGELYGIMPRAYVRRRSWL